MISSFWKIAWRNITKNKAFSFLNITGLSVGMASAILIILWIQNEFSYDQFHVNKDNIYEAWNRATFDGKLQCWNITPKILGPTLKQEYPGIVAFARTNMLSLVAAVGDKKVSTQALVVDPSFLTMFSLPLKLGNIQTALQHVHSMVITEKMARTMFGKAPAINKSILVDGDPFIITGILKDLPANTRFQFDYLLPWTYMIARDYDDDYWGNNSVNTFLQVTPGMDIDALNNRIVRVTQKHSHGQEATEVFLHPLQKWHLYSDFENGKQVGGFIQTVRLFGLIAAFILLIACINFMNLSTARSEKRALEVGIRKVAGATTSSLVFQFLGESLFIALFSGIIALILVQLCLPPFNVLVGKQLSIPFPEPLFWLFAIAFIFFTGLLAGSYPAFFLSAFRPVSVLKGNFKKMHALVTPRKMLVVLQFTFAIVLVISTITVVHQIQYAQHRETGYHPHLMLYHFLTGSLNERYPTLKNELRAASISTAVCRTSSPLTEGWSDTWDVQWPGKRADDRTDFDRYSTDEGLVQTAGLTLLEGRDMNLSQYPSDSSAMMLNASAVSAMGMKQAIGQLIKDNGKTYHVIGVIKDFVLRSPYDPVKPMIIEGGQGNNMFNVINIQLGGTGNTNDQLRQLQAIFKKYNPQYPFEYHFVDEQYARKFADTERIAALAALFAMLTILISCLGLFGLASFVAAQRTREIGMRKVLGATVLQLWQLLSKDFFILVTFSFVLATPIAWYFMHGWLQQFPYRTDLSWTIFAMAGCSALFITIITVSYQAIRAALVNPVKNLRTE